jgi:hypothetical protein
LEMTGSYALWYDFLVHNPPKLKRKIPRRLHPVCVERPLARIGGAGGGGGGGGGGDGGGTPSWVAAAPADTWVLFAL